MATAEVVPQITVDIPLLIRTMLRLYVRAFNNRDVDNMASMYTSDATVMPPNQPQVCGQLAIRDLFRSLVEAGCKNLEMEIVDLVSENASVVTAGRYAMDIAPRTGPRFSDMGKFVCILQRQPNGGYKYRFDIWNSDLPVMR